jgi:pimeloyl-ACP methyl ester carboxylesterase
MGGFIAQSMIATNAGRAAIAGICLVSTAPANATPALALTQMARQVWRHITKRGNGGVGAAATGSGEPGKGSRMSASAFDGMLPDCQASGFHTFTTMDEPGCAVEAAFQKEAFRSMRGRVGEAAINLARVSEVEWALEVSVLANYAMFSRKVSDLKQYPGMVLIIHGGNDTVIPKIAATFFQRIFNNRQRKRIGAALKVAVVPFAGHGLPILKTHEVAHTIISWCASTSSDRRPAVPEPWAVETLQDTIPRAFAPIEMIGVGFY